MLKLLQLRTMSSYLLGHPCAEKRHEIVPTEWGYIVTVEFIVLRILTVFRTPRKLQVGSLPSVPTQRDWFLQAKQSTFTAARAAEHRKGLTQLERTKQILGSMSGYSDFVLHMKRESVLGYVVRAALWGLPGQTSQLK
jgi:hypothetical protein